MSTKTRFEKEAKGNSEMVYCYYVRELKLLFLFIVERYLTPYPLYLTLLLIPYPLLYSLPLIPYFTPYSLPLTSYPLLYSLPLIPYIFPYPLALTLYLTSYPTLSLSLLNTLPYLDD